MVDATGAGHIFDSSPAGQSEWRGRGTTGQRLAGEEADETATLAFAAWLWAETRGLPFFIEALLQMLIEQGILVRRRRAAASLRLCRSLGACPLGGPGAAAARCA